MGKQLRNSNKHTRTYAAVLPGDSPVFTWENLTVAYETCRSGIGGLDWGIVLVEPNGTIGSGGIAGLALFNFSAPQQSYNLSS